jgi:anti-sigma B factor antagonist
MTDSGDLTPYISYGRRPAPLPDDVDGVTFRRVAGVELVSLVGELDLARAPQVERAIVARTAAADAVLIDLTAVSFLDSAGVRLLDTLVGGYEQRGAPVRLVVASTGAVELALRLCAFRDDLLAFDLDSASEQLR